MADGFTIRDAGAVSAWDKPDMSVMRLGRRAPVRMKLDGFGQQWRDWIAAAAEAASAPVDYVAAPLLSTASALIGNARWAFATPGWGEPPHLWVCAVGDSGSSKSPGADALLRDVLPEIERRMLGDFPDQLRDWQALSARALRMQYGPSMLWTVCACWNWPEASRRRKRRIPSRCRSRQRPPR